MKYGRRNPGLDLDTIELMLLTKPERLYASVMPGVVRLLLQEVRRQEGILRKERARTVRRREANAAAALRNATRWQETCEQVRLNTERRVWERAIGMLQHYTFDLGAMVLARQGWNHEFPNPTLDWFDQQIAEAEANSETSTFIAWLKQGRATITKETTQ